MTQYVCMFNIAYNQVIHITTNTHQKPAPSSSHVIHQHKRCNKNDQSILLLINYNTTIILKKLQMLTDYPNLWQIHFFLITLVYFPTFSLNFENNNLGLLILKLATYELKFQKSIFLVPTSQKLEF